MTGPLSNPVFRTLFVAQIFSLLAIGVMTVALALAAYRIGGETGGGVILGLLLAVKMIAYVLVAPVAEVALSSKPRKPVMIGLNLGRMLLLIPMAFAGSIWEIAALGFAFFAVSSGFTPLYQSVIPSLFEAEDSYAKALAYSRFAQTLEAILSPALAGAALWFVAPEHLFLVAAFAFCASILALAATTIPKRTKIAENARFWVRALKGVSVYGRTPRLRGLFLLNLALSLMMAWVYVNSVVFAAGRLGDPEHDYTILMAAYGIGAAIGALSVPRLVRAHSERQVMRLGVFAFAALSACIFLPFGLAGLCVLWAGFGIASSLVLTPGGLVIARSATSENRPAIFAAQFSLSHAGWLLAYPLAGLSAKMIGLEPALVCLAAVSVLVSIFAMRTWPAHDPLERTHGHPDLPEGHRHLVGNPLRGPNRQHVHAYYIDDFHPRWDQAAT